MFFLYSALLLRYNLSMSTTHIRKLLKERAELLQELATLSQILRGSWVERYSTCSRPQCKCHQGERHGPRRYLVVNEKGHQRQKYVPNAQVDAVLDGIEQQRKLQEIVNQITSINLCLMREGAYGQN